MGSGINFGSIVSSAIGGLLGGPIGMMVAQLGKQIMTSVIDSVIDQLPIDQGLKDILQAGFHAGIGDIPGALENINEAIEAFGQQAGGSPSDIGQMQGAVDDFRGEMEDMFSQLVQTIIDSADESDDGAQGAGGRGNAPGWLYAIAEVMGKKLDETAHKMADLAEKVDSDDPSTATDFQVASQQFSIMMNTTSTALKAIGEGMVAGARKQ
ncbi:MAG: hypothetical protein AB8G16_14500 [Gammaproteobacteria bacterium]